MYKIAIIQSIHNEGLRILDENKNFEYEVIDDTTEGNLLKKEVLPEDVANAFYYLAISEKTTAAVYTVDGGNIEASLR